MSNGAPVWAKLIAFVEDDFDGTILLAQGPFRAEVVHMGSLRISAYVIDRPTFTGLQVFRGYLTREGDDVAFCGQWDRLDDWEMSRMQQGLEPWEQASTALVRYDPSRFKYLRWNRSRKRDQT